MNQKFLFKFAIKKLLVALFLVTLSCSQNDQNKPPEIRIVDLNGNPKSIKRIIPEGNMQILASQQKIAEQNSEAGYEVINKADANMISPKPEAIKDLMKDNSSVVLADSKRIEEKPPIEEKVQKQATVSYDMSSDKDQSSPDETKPTKKFNLSIAKIKTSSINIPSKKDGSFIQLGSYSIAKNANKVLKQNEKISKGLVEEIGLNDKKSYRVLLGPISKKENANQILKQVKKSGYRDAFILK